MKNAQLICGAPKVRTKPESERLSEMIMVNVAREVRRELDKLARRDGVSLSELGRRALSRYLLAERGEEMAFSIPPKDG